MGRLTRRIMDEVMLKDSETMICRDICNSMDEYDHPCAMCPLNEAIKKLAHYEDLEEQGYKMVNTDKVVGQLLKNAYKVTEKNTNLEHSVIGLIDVIKIVKGGAK